MRSPTNHQHVWVRHVEHGNSIMMLTGSFTKCGLPWSSKFHNGGGRWCHRCSGEVANRPRGKPNGIPGKRGKGHAG